MWQQVLTQAFIVGLFSATIRVACPIMMAALGEVYSERAGVINVGLEGQMLAGALAGFLGSYYLKNFWLGMLCGALAGGTLALFLAFMCISLGANQIVIGVATSIMSTGLTTFVYQALFGVTSVAPTLGLMPGVHLPFLSDIPYLGPILFQQKPFVYLAMFLVPAMYLLLYKTTVGLQIRAVGEHPLAADTMGVNVNRTRYLCVLAAGLAAGLGGAMLSIGHTRSFMPGMSAGRGWIALAIVVVGGWNPLKILAASVFFGMTDSLQLSLQALGLQVPSTLLVGLPYVLTILLVAIAGAKARAPEAIGTPYMKQ